MPSHSFQLILNENQRANQKLATGCSKHCFEVVDETDEVSSKHDFEVVDETDEVSNHTYGKATLTWFEEIFEEYKHSDWIQKKALPDASWFWQGLFFILLSDKSSQRQQRLGANEGRI